MTKYRTDFEMQIDVEFVEPEKAKAFFIDGDWKESFWSFDDLDEVAESISRLFFYEVEHWNREQKAFVRFLEGYGYFVRQGDVYISSKEYAEAGEIRIREELELTESGTYSV